MPGFPQNPVLVCRMAGAGGRHGKATLHFSSFWLAAGEGMKNNRLIPTWYDMKTTANGLGLSCPGPACFI